MVVPYFQNWRRGLKPRTHTKKHQSLFLRDFRVVFVESSLLSRRSILSETVETRRTGTQLSCHRRNNRPAIAGGTDKLPLLSDNRFDGPEHSRQITRRRNYLSRSGYRRGNRPRAARDAGGGSACRFARPRCPTCLGGATLQRARSRDHGSAKNNSQRVGRDRFSHFDGNWQAGSGGDLSGTDAGARSDAVLRTQNGKSFEPKKNQCRPILDNGALIVRNLQTDRCHRNYLAVELSVGHTSWRSCDGFNGGQRGRAEAQ